MKEYCIEYEVHPHDMPNSKKELKEYLCLAESKREVEKNFFDFMRQQKEVEYKILKIRVSKSIK